MSHSEILGDAKLVDLPKSCIVQRFEFFELSVKFIQYSLNSSKPYIRRSTEFVELLNSSKLMWNLSKPYFITTPNSLNS